jgi:hypothetical protein
MKRLAWCLVALMVPALASAQADDNDSFINVTLTAPSYGGCDAGASIDALNCLELASAPLDNQFVFVVASHLGGYADGIGGAQFGLDHTLAGTWALCTGGSEIPEGGWPASGTGNAVTWPGGCYAPANENAKIGFVSVGGPAAGSIQVIGDPRVGSAQYANCSAVAFVTPATNLGGDSDLADGTVPTCEPTGTPTVEETWSSLKSLF